MTHMCPIGAMFYMCGWFLTSVRRDTVPTKVGWELSPEVGVGVPMFWSRWRSLGTGPQVSYIKCNLYNYVGIFIGMIKQLPTLWNCRTPLMSSKICFDLQQTYLYLYSNRIFGNKHQNVSFGLELHYASRRTLRHISDLDRYVLIEFLCC